MGSGLYVGFQYLDGLGREVGGNHAVAHLTLQQQGGRSVAGVAQGHEVTIARHAVGTTGTSIGTSHRALVQSLHVVHEIDFLQRVAQRQAYSGAGRTDVLERGGSGQTRCFLQLLHQLPRVQRVEEVDVAGAAVNHFDG